MKPIFCLALLLSGWLPAVPLLADPLPANPPSHADASPAPLLRMVLTPTAMDERRGGSVDVAITVDAMDVPAGEPLFTLPDMAPNMPSPQPRTGVAVTDAEGPVPLAAPAEAAGSRPWTATRRVHGEVTARYRLPIDNRRGSGPPINLRIDGRSFSTPGRMLLALPPGDIDYRVALRWDLDAMGPGAVGVTGYGDGEVTLPAGPVSRLFYTMFAAGHFQREPESGHGGFSALWGGEPPFDPRPLMQWTGRLHAWMSGFFGDETEPPYRVILRSNPVNPGGGVAMNQSFAVGYGPETTAESLKAILGHEMVHTWSAMEALGKWFSEGNAVYYQALLPWRAGMITTGQYLENLNRHAARYYLNPMRHTPEDEVLPRFWEDTRIRVLPYDRGAMYFAVLDGKVRKASGGRHSIDDLIRTMAAHRRADRPVTLDTWLDLLREHLGEAGPAVHRAMMAGELMLPEPDGFGPCFRRVTRRIRAFDMGYDLAAHGADSGVGGKGDRIVRGLKPGSEAEKAGVRDGDRILSGGPSDKLQLDVNRTVTLELERAGRKFEVTYLPRGEAMDAYQWERVPEVPETACR